MLKGQTSSIRSDRGSEFIDNKFKSILEDNNIKQILSLAHKPQSNGSIENFNKTLKKLIKMYLYNENKYDWTDILPEIINNYNDSYNFTTKEAPDYVIEEEYKDIHNNIKANNLKQRTQDKVKFNEGDKVRIKLENPDDYGKLWSDKIYIIDKVNIPKSRVSSVYYQLKGDNKHYYNNDLQN